MAATAGSIGVAGTYPAEVTFRGETTERNRVTTFFRTIVAIPAFIVLYIYLIGFEIVSFVAWLAIIFTGKYPESLFQFSSNTQRLMTDVWAYLFLLTDEYPPFSGSDEKASAYPAQYSISYPQSSNRVTGLFRFLLAIPALIYGMIAFLVAEVLTIVAWVTIVVTGRYPEGMQNTVQGCLRSIMRIYAYTYLMTDEYPPFSMS